MSSTEETTNSLSEKTKSDKIEKIMRCAKCLNHGDLVPVKGTSLTNIVFS
jgi:hypothetical protein